MKQKTRVRRIFACLIIISIAMQFTLAQAGEASRGARSQSMITVTQQKNIRVVYDVSHNVMDAGIGKALYYARGLLEAYKEMGVSEDQLHISVVVHGAAAHWLLNSDAYQLFVEDLFAFNPNEHVVDELIAHGVSVEICNVTMKSKGWTAEDILPNVKLVHDGYTRIIDLQQQGYSYLTF